MKTLTAFAAAAALLLVSASSAAHAEGDKPAAPAPKEAKPAPAPAGKAEAPVGEAPKPADAGAVAGAPAAKTQPAKPAVPAMRMNPILALSGSVVDAEGKPVMNAVISTSFSMRDGRPAPAKDSTTRADVKNSSRDGTFSVEVDGRAGVALCAMSADGTRGGFVVVGADQLKAVEGRDGVQAAADLTITLSPMVEVSGVVRAADAASSFQLASVSIATVPPVAAEGAPRLMAAQVASVSTMGRFVLRLPVGTYRAMPRVERAGSQASYDFRGDTKTFTVEAGKAVELEALSVRLSKLNTLIGKVLPDLAITQTRNTELKTLADYKGKWVILDFWGFW